MNTYTKSNRENTVFRCTRHYGSALYSYMAESLGRIVKRIVRRGADFALVNFDLQALVLSRYLHVARLGSQFPRELLDQSPE